MKRKSKKGEDITQAEENEVKEKTKRKRECKQKNKEGRRG